MKSFTLRFFVTACLVASTVPGKAFAVFNMTSLLRDLSTIGRSAAPAKPKVTPGATPSRSNSRESWMVTRRDACVATLAALVAFPFSHRHTWSKPGTLHDLSIPIQPGMMRYPGDPDPEFNTIQSRFGSFSLTMSTMKLGLHMGTHIDAPGHFVKGARTVDLLSIDTFFGQMYVVDLSHLASSISVRDLEAKSIPRGAKVFIKTRNSNLLALPDYRDDHVYLEPEAAEYLVTLGISLLAFDYYNIDNSRVEELKSHFIFAHADVPVIVGAKMQDLQEGRYRLSAAPLPLVGLEASPVRVVVWQE